MRLAQIKRREILQLIRTKPCDIAHCSETTDHEQSTSSRVLNTLDFRPTMFSSFGFNRTDNERLVKLVELQLSINCTKDSKKAVVIEETTSTKVCEQPMQKGDNIDLLDNLQKLDKHLNQYIIYGKPGGGGGGGPKWQLMNALAFDGGVRWKVKALN